MPTPTVRRLQLGHELKRLRDRAGMDITDAGKIIERAQSAMSRLEHGQGAIKQRDLRDLVEHFDKLIGRNSDGTPADGGDDFTVQDLLELNNGSAERGRWSGHRSVYANYFRTAVDLEADAGKINNYCTLMIAGLMRSDEYGRALMENTRSPDDETRHALTAQQERRENLTKEGAPEVNVLLHEAALRRIVGDREVMAGQMNYLIEMSNLPNVHVYVLTFDGQPTVTTSVPFTYFWVPPIGNNSPALEFVYVEQYRSADYYDESKIIGDYGILWDGLLGAALSPRESQRFLKQLAHEYE